MKMAEKTLLLTFKNNCESIDDNCVEVTEGDNEKNSSNDITTEARIIINKHDDEPNEVLLDNMDIMIREDAVDEFLAGEIKNEFHEELLLSDGENDNEGISFKTENVIMECNEIVIGENVTDETEREVHGEYIGNRKKYDANRLAKNLKRRSIKCLNKMQIMEDVREGCNVQPSSPGHAEQRADDNEEDNKPEIHTENGYGVDSPNNENSGDQNPEQDIKEEVETIEEFKETAAESNHLNDESNSNDTSSQNQNNKRKFENDNFSSVKRLRAEIQENFISRDRMLNDFIEMADCNNLEQVQTYCEQVLGEIKTLNEMAREKEREWNDIIHLKKIKEELLLRVQRKRQVMMMTERIDFSDTNESQTDNYKNNSSQSILKMNLTSPQKSAIRFPNIQMKNRNFLPRQTSLEMNGALDFRQGRQRPILDVQSIIADYRQRHPETVPRRGRRIRNAEGTMNSKGGILSFSSMALGTGSQVKHNLPTDINSELGLLLSTMDAGKFDGSRPSSAESAPHNQDTASFKDMLVQFAKLSQSERNEIIQNAIKPPPPYPEVTVLPLPATTAAPTNSLLHGILTKTPPKSSTKTSFSPTLARLLTAPEKGNHPASSTPILSSLSSAGMGHPPNMSISEILSTSKARHEITITPVGTHEPPGKGRTVDEEEAEDSVDRLVIDESNEIDARRADNTSETDEVPQCQGCNQKPAQFVCAGCGNQWYCSRDCQVTAWDEHSEICSG